MTEYQSYTTDSDNTRPGEPLPVGAHDPETPRLDDREPPGLPKPVDDLDRELAEQAHRLHAASRDDDIPIRRPDSATVGDARKGTMGGITPRDVRQSLLAEIARAAADERMAIRDWAAAVRTQQEARDIYTITKGRREDAEEALRLLDLWTEDDTESITPPPAAAQPIIPDAMIR